MTYRDLHLMYVCSIELIDWVVPVDLGYTAYNRTFDSHGRRQDRVDSRPYKVDPNWSIRASTISRARDYKLFLSMSQCSTHNLCSEMT